MKILLPIDGSKYSQNAIRELVRQISPDSADVCVLHIVQPVSLLKKFRSDQPDALNLPELRRNREAKQLVGRAANLLQKAGFRVRTAVRSGDCRAEILDYATDWGADLIILGSHGRGGLARILLGSVAEFVSRHARCSVEIVRIPAPNELDQRWQRGAEAGPKTMRRPKVR